MLNRLAENASHVWRKFFVWKKNEVRTSGKYSKFDFQNVSMKKMLPSGFLVAIFEREVYPAAKLMETKKPLERIILGFLALPSLKGCAR